MRHVQQLVMKWHGCLLRRWLKSSVLWQPWLLGGLDHRTTQHLRQQAIMSSQRPFISNTGQPTAYAPRSTTCHEVAWLPSQTLAQIFCLAAAVASGWVRPQNNTAPLTTSHHVITEAFHLQHGTADSICATFNNLS